MSKSIPSDQPEHAAGTAARWVFDGPVVADIAAAYTPGIAQMDARNAALALAARADDAAQLRAWLAEVGLTAVPAWKSA